MANVLSHLFVSAKSDAADASLVRPSDWNNEHKFLGGGQGQLIFRQTGLTGGAGWSGAALTWDSVTKTLAIGSGATLSVAGTLAVTGTLAKSQIYQAISLAAAEVPVDFIYNVKSYGAIGNGVANDTTAIQDCVTAAGAGWVYFPPGTYKITSTITWAVGGGRVMGAGGVGTSSATIITTASTITMFKVTGQAVSFSDFHMTSTAGTQTGIFVNGGNMSVIERVTMDNMSTGINMGATSRWTIRDVWITVSASGGIGILVNNTPNNCDGGSGSISDVKLTGPNTAASIGISHTAGGGMQVTGTTVFQFGHGIDITPAGGCITLSEFQFANNDISGSVTAGLYFDGLTVGLSGVKITGNHMTTIGAGTCNAIDMRGDVTGISITGNSIGSQGGTTIAVKLTVSGGVPQIITIVGNIIGGFTTGLSLDSGPNIVIGDNLFFSNTTDFAGIANATLASTSVPSALASLPTPANGSMMYCNDCKNTGDGGFAAGVCAGSGTGNIAQYLNSFWRCS